MGRAGERVGGKEHKYIHISLYTTLVCNMAKLLTL